MDIISLKRTLVRLEVGETALVLATSVILPFLVHLIPSTSSLPVGARLLPMFYGPLIAAILFRPHVAVVIALLSPSLNSLLMGHPLPEKVVILTLELVLFSVFFCLMHRRWRRLWCAAPIAYLAAVLNASYAQGALGSFGATIVNSLSGLAILLMINIFLLRSRSKDDNARRKLSRDL